MMRKLLLTLLTLLLTVTGEAQTFTIDGRETLLRCGEVSNSAATSVADIHQMFRRVRHVGLNTLIVPVAWEQLEPKEGRYDFTLTDSIIVEARREHLKVILLWFGAWKNSMSCYAPMWVKRDVRRFPRAMTADGERLEIATAFSKDVLAADMQAFCKLMQHLKAVDSEEKTVLMVQVENEIGMLTSPRDHCALAEQTYKNPPKKWLKALGSTKLDGSEASDEAFQACAYASYVEELARAGKAIYDIPMFVNAALNSRGRRPGQYPSAGPLAHLFPIWKALAPSIDLLAPDIYDEPFKEWAGQYKTKDNAFFTPETGLNENSGVRALWTFGELQALGYSVFDIDHAKGRSWRNLKGAYQLVEELTPLLVKARGKQRTYGLLLSKTEPERVIHEGKDSLVCRHYDTLSWGPHRKDDVWHEGGGLVLPLGKGEYLIAGNGLVVTFGKGRHIGTVDEVTVTKEGSLQFVRRDNGDQSHQGRHAAIACGEWRVLHVTLY